MSEPFHSVAHPTVPPGGRWAPTGAAFHHPLANLIAIEGRPGRIAVWAPNGALRRSLTRLFPAAECFDIGTAPEAAGADVIVLAPTLARSSPVTPSELARLASGLPAGGLLAVQQQALVTSGIAASAWTAGASITPDFEEILGSILMPLHRTEGRRGLGLWREVLWVGRRGRTIR